MGERCFETTRISRREPYRPAAWRGVQFQISFEAKFSPVDADILNMNKTIISMNKDKSLIFLPISLLIFFQVIIVNRINAYDPPSGAEELFSFGHPGFITSAQSSAGNVLFLPSVHAAAINPSLVAELQRLSVDLGYTALVETKDGAGLGNAFYAGMLFPTRFGVFSGATQGLFSSINNMDFGNVLIARSGFARDVTERLNVGAGLFGGGVFGGAFNDWALALDVGFMYKLGKLGFLKDARYGVALSNMGKTFVHGSDIFPAIFTFKAGFAANFLNKDKITAGFSADLSFPLFQNVIFNTGLQFLIANMIVVSAGWDVNVREAARGDGIHLPFLGIGVRFTVGNFMNRQAWEGSDFMISGAWRQIHDGIQLISTGASLNLGVRDSEPPIITIEEGE
ncbi:MAG: hypothetical protein LBH75_08100 [Treponema sp.]|jgi:hypothetical protein|nr:hypothetical protein [Treponema sp.]